MRFFLLVIMLSLIGFFTPLSGQQLDFYKNSDAQFYYTWNGNGTLSETTADQPFEGGQHLRFDYNFNGWWAGFGLGTGTLNMTPYTHLRVAYRGLSAAGEQLFVSLAGTGNHSSPLVPLGGAGNTYQTVDIPIWRFSRDSVIDLSEVLEIDFSVSGVPVAAGTVYVDAIELVTLPGATVDIIYKNGVNLISGSWGTPLPQETSLNNPYEGSQHLAFQNFNFNGNWWAGFGLQIDPGSNIPPYDFSAHSRLKFACRGLAAGYQLRLQLVSGPNRTEWITVATGDNNAAYRTIDVSLLDLVDGSGLSLHAITEIDFGLENGTANGSGSLYLDAIELTGPPIANGTGPTLAKTRAAAMGFGVNLSNWLEAFWLLPNNYPLAAEYTRSDLAFMKAMGVKTIRMPVIFERIANANPPYNLPASHAALSLADSVVAWTQALGLKLIIDNHHGYDLTDANWQAEMPRKTAVWKQILQRYGALDPDRIFFELYNEPTNAISNNNFRRSARIMLDTIRRHDSKNHTFIVGGNFWNSASSLTAMTPLPDSNLIYTFHSYYPFDFCNQGFTWVNPTIPTGITFPLPGQENALWGIFRPVKNWSTLYNVPVFLGEFGAGTNADPESRCRWAALHGEILDSLDMPAAYWDIKHWYDAYGWFQGGVIHRDSLVACFPESLGLTIPGSVATHAPVPAQEIRVWPNPANDAVFFEGDIASALVYDINGKIAAEYAGGQADLHRLNVGALPPGLYFLEIVGKNGVRQTGRFVKR